MRAIAKGFELIYKQLLDNLARLGAERIDPQGKPFDPHLHQAVDRAETTEHPDGTVLEVYQPGYVYHGRVLASRHGSRSRSSQFCIE